MSIPLPRIKEQNLIVISGYYGFDNLGDEAILEELINELKELVPAEKIFVLSNNPERTKAIHQVQSVDRWQLTTLFSLLNQTKLFISGGGGLFQDVTGPASVIYYGSQIIAACLNKVPVFIYAQGLGPLQSIISQMITSFAWRLASQITVRDEASLQMVKSWGLTAQLTADPVWSLTASTVSYSPKKQNLESPLIGISLRESPLLKGDYLKILPKALKSSFPANTNFLLLPLQKHEDLSVLTTLQLECEKQGLRSQIINTDDFNKPSQWLYFMQEIDMLVGMRFHALLMALKVGKPVIGLAYDPKVTYLCQTFEQPFLSQKQICDANAENLWAQTIKTAFNNRLELAQKATNKQNKIHGKELAKILIFSLKFSNLKIITL